MGAVVDAAQAAAVDVAVDLGGRERAVAEQLLDHAQVGAALEQVGRERVAKPVRVRRQAAERARVEPAAAGGEEDGVLRSARQLRAAFAQVPGEPEGGLLAERHGPLLAALAAHVDELLVEVDVLEVEADRLGAAQAGRVDELDERAVAEAERARRARARRAARRPRRPSARTGSRRGRLGAERGVGDARGAERRAEQRPHGGELPPDRRRRELRPPPSEVGDVVGEDADVDVVELERRAPSQAANCSRSVR